VCFKVELGALALVLGLVVVAGAQVKDVLVVLADVAGEIRSLLTMQVLGLLRINILVVEHVFLLLVFEVGVLTTHV